MILGIETSTKQGSLALVADQRLIGERKISDSRSHSGTLIPQLESLLSTEATGISCIDGIAVDIGPGSFTGIRVGLAVAKGLALGIKKPLVAVDSMDAMIFDFVPPVPVMRIIPFIDAKRDEIYASLYRCESQKMTRIKDPYLTDLASLLETIREKTVICGPDIDSFKEKLFCSDRRYLLTILDRALYPSARNVALIGERKLLQGHVPSKVSPYYLSQFKPTRPAQKI